MAIRGKNFKSLVSLGQKLVVILGPTAVGKSDLAVKLAQKFHGEIVSADSRQVYQGMNIGTGKITPSEMGCIPHHLLDVISPKIQFDVATYQKKATQAIQEILKRRQLPFLVGGSPFYLDAITKGWQFSKAKANPALRIALAQKSLAELLKILQVLDYHYFQKVEKDNKRRIIRAIEIASQLGKVPPRKENPQFQTLIIGLKLPLSELKKRIYQRLEKRFQQGMIQEVENLHRQGLSWQRLEDFGLEYRWISCYLQKKITIKEMKEKLQKETEKFAKRQLTWFKKDPTIHWIQKQEEAQHLIQNFLKEKGFPKEKNYFKNS